MVQKRPPAVLQGLEAGLKMFRWVVIGLLVLFCFSGIQEVGPDQVGLLLRLGNLHGANPAAQVKEPGLMLALPYPIDEVIEVPAKQEGEVVIDDVWKGIEDTDALGTIDPILEGYCLTGDQNVIQAKVVVKYKISDPVRFRLGTAEPEAILRDTVLSALTHAIAGWGVNDVLRLQQGDNTRSQPSVGLAGTVWQQAQQRLDGLDCGMTISALEFKEIHPPRHVITDFRAVQSAKIAMETHQREAEGFAAREIPKAEAEKNRLVQEAAAYENTLNAKASAELSVFEQLHSEYRQNSALVWNRIYLETVEYVLQRVGKLDFVSPEDRVILSDVEGRR